MEKRRNGWQWRCVLDCDVAETQRRANPAVVMCKPKRGEADAFSLPESSGLGFGLPVRALDLPLGHRGRL